MANIGAILAHNPIRTICHRWRHFWSCSRRWQTFLAPFFLTFRWQILPFGGKKALFATAPKFLPPPQKIEYHHDTASRPFFRNDNCWNSIGKKLRINSDHTFIYIHVCFYVVTFARSIQILSGGQQQTFDPRCRKYWKCLRKFATADCMHLRAEAEAFLSQHLNRLWARMGSMFATADCK